MLSLEYAAGFFDGEGTISLGRPGNRIELQVHTSNTNIPIIEAWRETFGGGITRLAANSAKNEKAQARWYITGADQQGHFLARLFPFLNVRQRQAQIALHYLSFVRPWDRRTPLTEDERTIRAEFQASMAALNHRGL